jgi:lipoate-protein ligase A
LRRCSGGGTVLQGPGCLNYSLILKINGNDSLKNIVSTNRFVMERHRAVLEKILGKKIKVQGSTDLTLENLKFSGNSQRRKRNALLFHGTFLLDFDLALIEKTLAMPPRQPAYRKERPHSKFVTNLKIPAEKIKVALKEIWGANKFLNEIPSNKIKELIKSRYLTDEWNLKF